MARQARSPRKRLVSKSRAVTERFSDDLNMATILRVDPLQCFPLIVDRDVHEGGIVKMMRVLTGQNEHGTGISSRNLCAGSGSPVVFVVTEQYRPYLRKFLSDKGLS